MGFIALKDVLKQYDDGEVTALNHIDLSIEKGSFVSIIGPSGSGKSTLLNMLGALDKPDSGEIIIGGINLSQEKDLSDFRRDEIGFVFQLHNLLPNLSVQENVEIPLVGTDLSENEKEKRALTYIEAVLDSKTGEMVLNVLKNMHEKYNVTLVIVTHDIDVAKLAERTIVIKDGQVIEDYVN